MYEVFWGCLVGGILFGLVSLLFGDGLGDAFDGVLDGLGIDGFDIIHPMTLVSGVTLFGGAGILLTDYSDVGSLSIILLSAIVGILGAILLFFVYVRPMRNTDSSLGFSENDLVGRTAEVSIPIPAEGHGQVEVRFGSQLTYQIAESYDGKPIPTDTRVLVVAVEEGVLSVEVAEH